MSTQDAWSPGTEAWFEYHCFESEQSQDAALWHRSHEQVTVLEHIGPDGHDCFRDVVPTLAERGVEGAPCMYLVRFMDGWEHDVFEDELVTDRADFFRPDPPEA